MLTYFLLIADEKFLCTQAGELVLASNEECTQLALSEILSQPMKSHTGDNLIIVQVALEDIEGYQWRSLRNLIGALSEEEFQTAGRALQMLRWHYDHQYCGRCGRPTVQHEQDLAKSCLHCSIDFYPRLSPCVITLVTQGDYCLLAWHLRAKEEKYSCLAGFIEIGETPEQTVVREVLEEVGVTVNNIRYVASQPWPFPGQLMLGYFADYLHGEIVVDTREIVAAKWYKYNELPNTPPVTTISGRLINTFVEERYRLQQNKK